MPKGRHATEEEGALPRRVFVDSSGWIAFFSARDQYHSAADQLFRSAIAREIPLITTNLILAEVHRLILFRAGTRAAARVLDRIEASSRVSIEFPSQAHHRAARVWLDRLADEPVTYTDAVSFAVMESLRCRTALSFDRHFLVAGFSLWK